MKDRIFAEGFNMIEIAFALTKQTQVTLYDITISMKGILHPFHDGAIQTLRQLCVGKQCTDRS